MADDSTPSTPRRKYASAQREHILNSAATVFTNRGFERATTKAIAAEAGLSEGALYHHFRGKRDLLVGVLQRVIGGAQVEGGGGGGAADMHERYRRAINNRVRHAHPQMTTFFAVLSAVLADDQLAEQVRTDLLEPGIERAERSLQASISGGAMRSLDVPAAARLVYAIFMGIELLAQMGDEESLRLVEEGDRLGETFATLVLDGLNK
jgi:AcrR family transcriptional regulator